MFLSATAVQFWLNIKNSNLNPTTVNKPQISAITPNKTQISDTTVDIDKPQISATTVNKPQINPQQLISLK